MMALVLQIQKMIENGGEIQWKQLILPSFLKKPMSLQKKSLCHRLTLSPWKVLWIIMTSPAIFSEVPFLVLSYVFLFGPLSSGSLLD
jgi:hypothetical protein